jgi:hypothetical protein
MKSDPKLSLVRATPNGVRQSCKKWRQLVNQCAQTYDLASASMEERYKTVHHDIVTLCRDVAEQEQVSESQRRAARQLDELLRPWSSLRLFKDAPPHLVQNLLKSQAALELQLRGNGQDSPAQRLKSMALTALIAAACGILIALGLQFLSGFAFQPTYRFLDETLISIRLLVSSTTFTQQLAVAILLAWIVGTCLMSRIYSK